MSKKDKKEKNNKKSENQEVMEAQNDNQRNAVELLQECHNECQRMFMAYAAKESGQTLPYLHLKRLQACIEICESTAGYLLKDGVKADRLCEIAAQICEQCADSCEKLGDEYAQQCAQLCRDAAQACLEESHRLKVSAAA